MVLLIDNRKQNFYSHLFQSNTFQLQREHWASSHFFDLLTTSTQLFWLNLKLTIEASAYCLEPKKTKTEKTVSFSLLCEPKKRNARKISKS